MNIFVVDINPIKAAQALCDKHVIKMTLETAQILSTINGGPYRPTHYSHPCVAWARSYRGNYDWLVKHGLALAEEYTYRYGKVHKSQQVIESLFLPTKEIPDGISPFAQCMPEEYRQVEAVEAYRLYYVEMKSGFATWTKREEPWWWNDNRYRRWRRRRLSSL